MATAKVRIFELAKELGISSKELIGLFERLGLEAKNQLSVVDDKIADLVRGVLLRKGQAAAANAAKASAATAVAEPEPVTHIESALPPEPVVAQAAVAAAVPEPVAIAPVIEAEKSTETERRPAAPRPAIFDDEPVPMLRPVPPAPRRPSPSRQDPVVARLIEDDADDVETQPIPPLLRASDVQPVVAEKPVDEVEEPVIPQAPPRQRTTFDTEVTQLRPVPQQSPVARSSLAAKTGHGNSRASWCRAAPWSTGYARPGVHAAPEYCGTSCVGRHWNERSRSPKRACPSGSSDLEWSVPSACSGAGR